MKNSIIILFITFTTLLFSQESALKLEKARIHPFKESFAFNAKIIQLSNAQQSIVSMVNGHLEKYFVEPAADVKRGEKIALIESIELSRMSAEYIALKKQYLSAVKNYRSLEQLYEKGMVSQAQLNSELIQKSKISAKLTTLESQLETLGIDTDKLKKATSSFVLYAHSDGRIAALLKPLHSSVSTDEAVVRIVKNQAYYIKAYLPLEYALKVRLGDLITAEYAGSRLRAYVTQVLPQVDDTTQQAVVLAAVEAMEKKIFLGVYLEAKIYYADAKSYVALKRSALSFFQNEWVVFLPRKEEHESKASQEHHDEAQYIPRVVEILASDEEYVGVRGVDEGELYVSDKSYYVKSLLLKSSLGEHGH